jgi:hypothetical protein
MKCETHTEKQRTVTVWHFRTVATDDLDTPSWWSEELSVKEAAIREIKMQPFYVPNVEVSGSL